MMWQPIATAPKDGTHILLFAAKAWYPMVERNAEDSPIWTGYFSRWVGGEGEWTVSGMEFHEGYGPPTHWMPLPEPPQ